MREAAGKRPRQATETDGRASDPERDGELKSRLLERSRQLAARKAESEERQVLTEVVVARRGDVQLAVPIAACSEVRAAVAVRIPAAGEVACGVFHVRGRVHGLVDLGMFFGASDPLQHGKETLVMVIKGPPGSLGLRIDELVGPRVVFVDEVESTTAERGLSFVSHVSRDLVHIIDPEALMAMAEVRIARQQT